MSSNSVTFHIFRVLASLVLVAVLQAVLAGFSLNTLSAVRAYVAGEGLWTKGQKDAIFFLDLYATSGNEAYYRQYQTALAVPLADRDARYALEQEKPDIARAKAGFLGGNNHPDDVDGMIWLFQHFRWFPPFKLAVNSWIATDDLLGELDGLGRTLHERIAASRPDPTQFNENRRQISELNSRLTPQAIAFSNSLGSGSRLVTRLLTSANVLFAALVILLGGLHARRLLVQRASFEKTLSWQAAHDDLTHLPNRREFERQLDTALKRMDAGQTRPAVIFVDLDRFKLVNDTGGHAAGDELLKSIATHLQNNLPPAALLARLGGDEFAILLKDCSQQDSDELGEHLRRSIEELDFAWNDMEFRVTASIGVVHIFDSKTTLEETLRTADMACYAAKKAGRNRMRVSDASAGPPVIDIGISPAAAIGPRGTPFIQSIPGMPRIKRRRLNIASLN